MMKSITFADKILAGVLAAVTIASFFAGQLLASPGSIVIVELNGNPVYKGNLSEDRKVTVRGTYGDVRMQVREGRVGVVYADCPNNICVRTGWRTHAGESVICVPNRVVIRILGEDTTIIRGVTG